MGTSSGPTISTAVLTPQQLWLATLKKWSYNSPNISPSGTLHSFEYFSPENVLFSESQTSQSSWKIPILSWFINFKRKSAETTSSKQTSSFDKRNKFFQSTQGEVYFNEATCPVFKVDINNAIPTFTFGFIEPKVGNRWNLTKRSCWMKSGTALNAVRYPVTSLSTPV